MQHNSESLHEVWERFKDLLRKCPHHEFAKWLQVQTFYNRLNEMMRTTVDVVADGALMAKDEHVAWDLLEEMANNNSLWPTKRRSIQQQVATAQGLALNSSMNAKLDQICKWFEVIGKQPLGNTGFGGGQPVEQYTPQEEVVNYMQNFNRRATIPI